MITCNGILGLSLLLGALRRRVAVFNPEGTGGALATVLTLATLSLVVPTLHHQAPGPEFSPAQLAFAAVASLALYGLFVLVQTGRHRDYFLPVTADGQGRRRRGARRAAANRAALISLACCWWRWSRWSATPRRSRRRSSAASPRADLPQAFVGVIIALLVLLPETLAAARAARRDRVQISLNLALGSAMASIGLTIPAIAVASIWLDGPLLLGLGGTQLRCWR